MPHRCDRMSRLSHLHSLTHPGAQDFDFDQERRQKCGCVCAAHCCGYGEYDCSACLRARKRPRPEDGNVDGHDSDGGLDLPWVAPFGYVAVRRH